MHPTLRQANLTTHVLSSVGWFGAVLVFLVLSVSGLTASDDGSVRGAYVAMDLTARWVIVPLATVAFATGLMQSLTTPWGLFRHYWIVAKLFITLIATALLWLHLQPIGHLADVVRDAALAHGEARGLRIQMVATSAAAAVGLALATVLSVVKPRGLTRYGWSRQRT